MCVLSMNWLHLHLFTRRLCALFMRFFRARRALWCRAAGLVFREGFRLFINDLLLNLQFHSTALKIKAKGLFSGSERTGFVAGCSRWHREGINDRIVAIKRWIQGHWIHGFIQQGIVHRGGATFLAGPDHRAVRE